MSQAVKIPLRALPEMQRKLHPEAFSRVQGDGRKIAVAKLREFADMLESGELDGCRVQWRDDHGAETEMVTVTITHATDEHGGMVQMLTTKIEEA
jgi:hypothetical protein